MVRRTSPAARSTSTFSPSASSAVQASPEIGCVMRGISGTCDAHLEREFRFGRLDCPGDRRRGLEMQRGDERDVALGGEQAGCRIEADPARAWKKDLRPGVQV